MSVGIAGGSDSALGSIGAGASARRRTRWAVRRSWRLHLLALPLIRLLLLLLLLVRGFSVRLVRILLIS